jgi:multiple sugar transport system substrate-binding protein
MGDEDPAGSDTLKLLHSLKGGVNKEAYLLRNTGGRTGHSFYPPSLCVALGRIVMDERRLTRRDFLRLSTTLVTGATLAACAPAAAPAPPAAEKPAAEAKVEEKAEEKPAKAAEAIHLRWWYGWGGVVSDTLHKVAEAFSEERDDLELEAIQTPELQDKLLTSIAAGDPPDVQAGNADFAQFMSRGACIPLGDMIDASSEIPVDDYPEDAWAMVSWEGERYCIPMLEAFVREGFIYNVGLVKDAGLDPEAPPLTWDETYDWHVKLTQFDDAGNVTLVGIDPMDAMGGSAYPPIDPFVWARLWGFDYFDEESKTYNLDNPDMVDILKTIKMFYDHVGVEKMDAFRKSYGTWTGPQASFPSGTQVMQVNGYWTPPEMAHNAQPGMEFAYTWVPMPAKRKGIKLQMTAGHAGFIPMGAAHPEASFEALEYLQGEKAHDIIYNGCGFIGARMSLVEKLDASKYPGLDWYFQSVKEADEMWGGNPDPNSNIFGETFRDTVDAVNFGQKTAEQAAKDMQSTLTKAMEDVLEAR